MLYCQKKKKEYLLTDKTEFKNSTYNVTSVYYYNHKKIFYFEIFKNPPKDLALSILRVAPRIDMTKIDAMIHEVPYISDVDKQFFKESIKIRKELIIDPAYKRIRKNI